MTKEEYSINIEKLISWAKAYYVDDEPIASDEEYDKLARECLEFENKNPTINNSKFVLIEFIVQIFFNKFNLNYLADSCLSIFFLMSNPQKYPPKVPSERIILWHGIRNEIGFCPIAVATARIALGLPICSAICL